MFNRLAWSPVTERKQRGFLTVDACGVLRANAYLLPAVQRVRNHDRGSLPPAGGR